MTIAKSPNLASQKTANAKDVVQASAHGIARLGVVVVAVLARHRTRRHLGDLSAEQLNDIGLTRAQAEAESRKRFWRS